jgi:2-methylcitrate dehydratase PrpD
VSVQHAVAAALVLDQAGLAQFTDECARDPKVIEMRRKVEVIRDPAIATIAAEVELWTADGTRHALSTPAARGSPSNPMSDRDIEDKLRTIAAAWRPGHDVAPLIEAVWNLERSNDVSRLLALTVPKA